MECALVATFALGFCKTDVEQTESIAKDAAKSTVGLRHRQKAQPKESRVGSGEWDAGRGTQSFPARGFWLNQCGTSNEESIASRWMLSVLVIGEIGPEAAIVVVPLSPSYIPDLV